MSWLQTPYPWMPSPLGIFLHDIWADRIYRLTELGQDVKECSLPVQMHLAVRVDARSGRKGRRGDPRVLRNDLSDCLRKGRGSMLAVPWAGNRRAVGLG